MHKTIKRAAIVVGNTVELRTRSRELMARSAALLEQSDTLYLSCPTKSMVHFLNTDLKVGLTFARIALQRRDKAERKRNQRSARIAYDTVLGFFKRVRLSDTETAEVQSRAADLRTALKKLGESV